MTDVWRGDILLPGGESVKDVGFSTAYGTASPTLPAASLRYLSTVDVAKIPLYLASGPSCDVWTTSEASEAWFEAILLSQTATATAATVTGEQGWWTLARAQSPVGILVQVESQKLGVLKPRITEFLLYGTIAATHAVEGLATPPSSYDVQPGLLPELHVHAIPLSVDLLYQSAASTFVPLSPTATVDQPGDIGAQYLLQSHHSHTIPHSPKRKRDLFEEATLAKRKAKSKGGDGVAVVAAAQTTDLQRPHTHRKSASIDTKPARLTEARPSSAHGPVPRSTSQQLSRSPSINSDTRPLSRKETAELYGRRSHLSQVDTVSSQPKEFTTESRNKEALTKVVLAAMRMHGLQQRNKTKSRRASLTHGTDEAQASNKDMAAEDAAKDEEFKLIYHLTYKGAVLALRKYIAEKPLHAQPDRMRDLVEQFLTLFLNDPLSQPLPSDEPTNPVATPGVKQCGIFGSSHHASPFDLPSGMRRPPISRAQTDDQVYTGSPYTAVLLAVIRKKSIGGSLALYTCQYCKSCARHSIPCLLSLLDLRVVRKDHGPHTMKEVAPEHHSEGDELCPETVHVSRCSMGPGAVGVGQQGAPRYINTFFASWTDVFACLSMPCTERIGGRQVRHSRESSQWPELRTQAKDAEVLRSYGMKRWGALALSVPLMVVGYNARPRPPNSRVPAASPHRTFPNGIHPSSWQTQSCLSILAAQASFLPIAIPDPSRRSQSPATITHAQDLPRKPTAKKQALAGLVLTSCLIK
ncbi:hypothetical protein OPT61_g6567 [Boeremia exigua]|uniref:Uncharacterized protein n=1 Tax=Boeremia exigua TaxID=749465 RepID=A0ACC2I6A4_9PLEO|nr:hypothetical protein OPT61_g6567 [Boeremia exigua]